jgi:arginine decarboxylase
VQITITTGTGHGPTPLAAFDAALRDAGIANYNLIYLSSVIPTGCVLERAKYRTPIQEYGHRLYIVMARQDAQVAGETAWAGLGWTQEEATGRGLFVELHGASRPQLEQDIQATLRSMIASRSLDYGPIETELSGIECRGEPVCALAIAVCKSEGWEGDVRRAGHSRKKQERSSRFTSAASPHSPALASRITLLQKG